MEELLTNKIQQYGDALINFEESLSIDLEKYPEIVIDSLKSGRIQIIELCIELLWKTVKSYLWEINGMDSKSPKIAIKDFYNLGYLTGSEYEHLIEALDDRNKLSHVYNQEQFEGIYQRVIKKMPLFIKVNKFLKKGLSQSSIRIQKNEGKGSKGQNHQELALPSCFQTSHDVGEIASADGKRELSTTEVDEIPPTFFLQIGKEIQINDMGTMDSQK